MVNPSSSMSFPLSSAVSVRTATVMSLRLNQQNGQKISDLCLSEILWSTSPRKLKAIYQALKASSRKSSLGKSLKTVTSIKTPSLSRLEVSS